MKFKVTSVKFDTDGDKKLAAKLAKQYKGWEFEADDDHDADERAADILSDRTGWCVSHVGYKPVAAKAPKGSITFKNLVETARALRSEDGDENNEYDRALCELVGDAMGTTQEGYPEVAAMLGVSIKVWE
jgi:hypothetical protein